MNEAEIAIVVSPRPWAEQLHRFLADHGGARVRARVLDAREALDDAYSVLVAEDLTSFLTTRLVDELHRRGRRVLGVFDPQEPWGRDRLQELGADDTVPLTAAPEDMVARIAALAATGRLDQELSQLVATTALPTTAPTGPAVPAPPPPEEFSGGVIWAIGGPPGGVGATEVTIALATEFARRGSSVVLVDADEVAPSVAQRLGLPLHPNIRTAVDAVEHRTARLSDSLSVVAGGGFEVLSGLPNPRDWAQLRPSELTDVLDELADQRQHVLVNIGPHLEDLSGFGGPSRFALSRTALALADVVVAVAAPTPVGVARLLDWIADLRAAVPQVPLHIAVNKSPSGRFKRGELEDEIRRTVAVPELTFLPADHRVEEAAWDGTLVATGPFADAVTALADALTASAAPPPVRRRGLLAGLWSRD